MNRKLRAVNKQLFVYKSMIDYDLTGWFFRIFFTFHDTIEVFKMLVGHGMQSHHMHHKLI